MASIQQIYSVDRNVDLNGRALKLGDVIFRFSSGYRRPCYEIVTRFSASGNALLKKAYCGKLVDNGYLTSAYFTIIDTPIIDQDDLDLFNNERINMGLSPLKRYGNT